MNRPKRILIVDDEEPNRELLAAMLESLGHESEVARNGFEAIEKLTPDIDLVLLDAMMPGIDGFDVVRSIRGRPGVEDIPVIMVTALTSKEDRLRAVEAGANDFISKPIDKTEIRVRTASMLKMKEAQDAIKRHQAVLEETVEKRTAALRQALAELDKAQQKTYAAHLDTIQRLAVAAEFKDKDTASHIQRMSYYCSLLAQKINLPPGEVEIIHRASPMHDVGKIGIPDNIILKPGKLTGEEWEIMKQHTSIGARILNGSSSDLLQAGEIIALSHHERWDGGGYPNALAGKNIPLWGRICTVADVFDALTSERPYKKAFTNEKALEILKEERGKHFDPELIDIFIENFNDVITIQKKYWR